VPLFAALELHSADPSFLSPWFVFRSIDIHPSVLFRLHLQWKTANTGKTGKTGELTMKRI